MTKSISIFIALLCCSLSAYSQQYMYIYDNDLYANVRLGAGSHFAVVDTLYHLELVKINDPEPGDNPDWLKVDKGYVHKSRFKKYPEKLYPGLDSVKYYSGGSYNEGNHYERIFLTSPDTPEIITAISSYFKKQIHKDNKGKPTTILFYPEDVIVKNMLVNEVIDGYDVINPAEMTLSKDEIKFKTDYYLYSFYRNGQNKLCRGLTLLDDYFFQKLSEKELASTLDIARKAFAEAKKIENAPKGINYEFDIVYNGIGKHISVNNFKYLSKLEAAYFMGNKNAEKLYPYIQNHFPVDGEGGHVIGEYSIRLYGFENKGEIVLE